MISKPMTRENPTFISPSGRFVQYLFRREKRKKLHKFIVSQLEQLLKSPPLPVENVSTEKADDGVFNVDVDYFSNICNLHNRNCMEHIDSVETGINRVVNSMIIPPSEAIIIANDIRDDLTKVFQRGGHHGNLLLYGSYFTGLCTTISDVDFIFELHNNASGKTSKDIASSIMKILKSSESGFSEVKVMPGRTITTIECVHKRSQKKCDITFGNKMGIQNSKLMKLYLSFNSNLKIVILYFKHLLNKYEILGKGRITTHILFWMVVFFMQQKDLLPPVKTVREACSSDFIINGTNCAVPESFDNQLTASSINTRLCSLVLNFATYYRDFRLMKYVMSPHSGKYHPIDQAEKLKETHGSNNFSASFINIQHPSDLESNLSVQTKKGTVNVFGIVCCHISKILPHYMRYSKECNRTLDDILRKNVKDLPYVTNQPKELVQCASFSLKANSPKRLTERAIETVRKVMENVFGFKATKIVKKYVDQAGKNNVSTVYCFSYSSTPEMWNNNCIRPILPGPRFYKRGESDRKISAFVMCEIVANKRVKIMIESEAHFMNFLDEDPRCIANEGRSDKHVHNDMYVLPRPNVYAKRLFEDIFAKTD